ncbi:HEAT repeat domain-containing protein [Spirulina sp. 06S082]|uniref:HEAT repeat domain-containing protein n=1 Tax=Spirulina sp. 06S082 TaxID=3110248 RepID=UPI002B218F2E|nr:HEAT repeat domain-containing protein [Spirulina sp. 06S082]MEA5467334.1 HEAT repeat domain-containing protein [Spirulina sp. 06S082]
MNEIATKPPVQDYIKAVDLADSSDGLLDAVKALADLRQEQALPKLIEILGYNNPGAAVAAVEGLINLGIPAVPALLEQLDGYNYGARAWAIRALAGIGDPRAIDTLTQAAKEDFSFSVRRAASRGLGNILWSELPASERETTQKQVIDTLILVSQDVEWVVRYAAVLGLQGLATQQSIFTEKVCNHLQTWQETESELTIRARIQLALQRLQNVNL